MAERKTDQYGTPDVSIPQLIALAMAAATTIEGGQTVFSNSSGLAVPWSADGTLKAWGRAEKKVDNSAGAAGDLTVDARTGYFWYANAAGADALSRADIGNYVYMSAAATAAKLGGAGARPLLGVMVGTAADLGGPSGQVCIAVGVAVGNTPYATNPDVQAGSTAFMARNVAAAGNVADLGAFTVAGNDGVTNVEGDVVILAEQTTTTQNGPYVVGVVGGGTAPLTRPEWWANGTVFPVGTSIRVAQGTVFKNTTWKSMRNAATFTVGTHDPDLYPESVSGTTALVAGTFTISTVPVFNAKSAIHFSRSIANTSTATTGGYHATNAGADGITPGKRGTAAVIVQATVAAGTINAADISTLHWTIINQAA